MSFLDAQYAFGYAVFAANVEEIMGGDVEWNDVADAAYNFIELTGALNPDRRDRFSRENLSRSVRDYESNFTKSSDFADYTSFRKEWSKNLAGNRSSRPRKVNWGKVYRIARRLPFIP